MNYQLLSPRAASCQVSSPVPISNSFSTLLVPLKLVLWSRFSSLGHLVFFYLSVLRCIMTFHSHIDCCWSRRRHNWPEGNPLHWGNRFHHWWCYSNIHHRFLCYDRWPSDKRLWSRALVVSPQGSNLVQVFSAFFRTIVPIYQSEISPPDHVGLERRTFIAPNFVCREVHLRVWNLPVMFSAMQALL
jgi:hypothetical protein